MGHSRCMEPAHVAQEKENAQERPRKGAMVGRGSRGATCEDTAK